MNLLSISARVLQIAMLMAPAATLIHAQNKPELPWLPPAAELMAPDCPTKVGLRESRSAVATSSAGESAHFMGGATHEADGSCRQSLVLVLKRSDNQQAVALETVNRTRAELAKEDLDAPDLVRSFSIVDFSANGRELLLEKAGTDSWKDNTFRDVEIALLDLQSAAPPKWINVWDIMKWTDCDATVEAQGFNADGRPVLRVRPSVWQSKPKPDCVDEPELWAVNLEQLSAARLPDNTELNRVAHASGADQVACKRDPDLVGACFVVRGRLGFYNGTPSLRIWKVGTNRLLGVTTETAPENVDELLGTNPWDTEIYGDFAVCPFTRDKPGAMQSVCIESASHLTARPR